MRAFQIHTAPRTAGSGKLRAWMRWSNLPFRDDTITPNTLRTLIRPRVRRVAAPVVIDDQGALWSDSIELADALSGRIDVRRPSDPAMRFANDLIEAWADLLLARSAEYFAWVEDAAQTRDAITAAFWPDGARRTERRLVRSAVSLIRSRLRDQAGDVEQTDQKAARLQAELLLLDRALSSRPYLMGRSPMTADFAVYGALSVLAASSRGADMLSSLPHLTAWLGRVAAPGDAAHGPVDRITQAPSAFTLLCRHAAESLIPAAIASADAIRDWAESNPAKRRLPERIKLGTKTNGGSVVETASAWRLQRLARLAKPEHGVQHADLYRLLKALSLLSLQEYTPPREIERVHHRFELTMRDVHDDGSESAAEQVRTALCGAGMAARELRDIASIYA